MCWRRWSGCASKGAAAQPIAGKPAPTRTESWLDPLWEATGHVLEALERLRQ